MRVPAISEAKAGIKGRKSIPKGGDVANIRRARISPLRLCWVCFDEPKCVETYGISSGDARSKLSLASSLVNQYRANA
jgi:hypothetical protein